LRDDKEGVALPDQPLDDIAGKLVLRARRVGQPQQNVGVDEDPQVPRSGS
jgi:hypothetical protein